MDEKLMHLDTGSGGPPGLKTPPRLDASTEAWQAARQFWERLRDASTAGPQPRLLDAVGQPVIATDLAGTIVYWNPAAEALYGWPAAEVVGRNVLDVLPAEAQRGQAAALLEGLRDGQGWSGEFLMRRRDGTVFPAHLVVTPIRDAAGCIVGSIGTTSDVTERQRVEEELRASRHFLRSILDALSDHIAVLDEEGTIIAVNEAWRRFGEANGADMSRVGVGVNYLAVCRAAEADGVAEADAVAQGLRDVMTHRRDDFRLEYPCHAPTEKRWFTVHANRLEADGPVRVVVAHENITERKLAEEALRRSEARFRSLAEAIPQQVWTAHPDGALDYVNDRVLDYFGRTFDEMIGWGWQQVVHPDDLASTLKQWTHSLETGDLYEIEFRLQRAHDGMYRWHLGRALPLRDAHGNILKWFGTNTDITERKRVETLLAGQKRVLELIAQGAPLPRVLEVLVQTVEEQANHTLLASVLLLDEDGVHLRHGAAPSLPARYNEAIDGLAIGPSVGSCGTAAFRKEAVIVEDIAEDPLWVNFRELALRDNLRACWSTPIIATDGRVVGTFAVYYRTPRRPSPQHIRLLSMHTRTAAIAIERHRAERQLKELNESLERRVAERTAELEQANAALQRRNRELQDFAYVASHDLQEPLRKIGAFADLFQEEYAAVVDETGQYYLDRVQDAAQRMTTLITDLLTLSRVATQGRSFEQVDLNEVANGVISDLEFGTTEAEGRVAVEALPTIDADPMQMRQLFQNVIGNALKFSRPGEPPVVHIAATVEESEALSPGSPQPVCRLTVRDNGIGFDEKYLDRIFSPFQRLHGRSEYPGTGIGLAICRRIVERHRGAITAASTPGGGATFVITLPLHHDTADASAE